MKPSIIVFLALVPCAPTLDAQTGESSGTVAGAVRSEITPARLETHTRAIVRHQRPSGSPGENAAIDYIVETLGAAGVPIAVHTFDAYTSDPISASLDVVGTDFSPDAITVSFSGAAEGVEGDLVDVGALANLPRPELGTGERLVLPTGTVSYPRLDDAIVMVEGQPRNVPTAAIAALGAAGIIFVNPEERLNDLIVTSTWGIPSLRNFHRLPTIPVIHVKRSAGEYLRARLREGAVRVRLSARVETGWKPLRLAVATVRADVPEAPVVVLGGHIDGWHHAATDEGASNAAMVELARAFHANRHRLRRDLWVAWWPGHSNARYGGSTWFADRYYGELRERGVAYVNVDGIGQMGAKRFGAATTASLADLAIRVVRGGPGAEISPSRPGRNSDQSFNGIGLPLLQLYHNRLAEDDGYWWWHTPDDTFDKVDFDVLKVDTDLYVNALAELLVSPRLPVNLTDEVRALGEAIERRQQRAGDRFDLHAAMNEQGRLLEAVMTIDGLVTPQSAIDVELVRVLRPIHRVLYSPFGPYHPDPGTISGRLPGLAPVEILASDSPDTDRYRFAMASLVRERNRLVEAIRAATREAHRAAARLGGG